MKAAVVLNTSAGALVGKQDTRATLQTLFGTNGIVPDFIAMDAGDLPARVALARDSGAETVIVVGGDGSIACAAQALAGSGKPLGIIPTGTMNLLARDLHLPIGDMAEAVRVIAQSPPRRIDVGEVNGQMFLCASMLGLPTELARYRESARGGSRVRLWARFGRAAFRLITRYRPRRMVLRIDGVARALRTPSVTVTVNPMSDNAGQDFGRETLDGGRLGVYIVRRLRLRDAARLVLAAKLRRWRHDPAVEEVVAETLDVVTRNTRMRVMNDGESRLLPPPLHYTVRGRDLLVLAPQPAPPPAPPSAP